MKTRPLSVTVLACLYLGVGMVGSVYHVHDLRADPHSGIWIELTEFVALVCGVFLLRGQNWARWLALVWIIFHVVVSAPPPWGKFSVHLVLAMLIAWILFRPPAGRYFRGTGNTESRV
jgi:hypothetical protein